MELRVNEVQIPENITFNYEELKQALTKKVSMYETMVYTDDQIKEAKADKAQLNKLKKALNDERIRREKEYMQPFNEFKTQINEIIGIIDKPVAVIDAQVKAYEDKQKQDKMELIKALWKEQDVPEGLTLEKVFDERMLNVSYTMSHVKQKMLDDIKRFNRDMTTLANLPEYSFEAQQMYISTLDITKALNEAHRLSDVAKKKAEYEAEQSRLKAETEAAEPKTPENGCNTAETNENTDVKTIDENKQWVSFRCQLTVEDAQALGQFFKARNIAFEQI